MRPCPPPHLLFVVGTSTGSTHTVCASPTTSSSTSSPTLRAASTTCSASLSAAAAAAATSAAASLARASTSSLSDEQPVMPTSTSAARLPACSGGDVCASSPSAYTRNTQATEPARRRWARAVSFSATRQRNRSYRGGNVYVV